MARCVVDGLKQVPDSSRAAAPDTAMSRVWNYTERRKPPVSTPIPLHCAGIHADQVGGDRNGP